MYYLAVTRYYIHGSWVKFKYTYLYLGINETDEQVKKNQNNKHLLHKSDNLGLIPGTCDGREEWIPKICPMTSTQMPCHVCMCVHMHAHIYTHS